MVYAEHLLSNWESGILICARQRCLCYQFPIQILHAEPLMSFPGGQHFTRVVITLLEELSMSCVTSTGGEDSWKLTACFLWTVPHAPFPFFPLYLFTVLNHSKSLTICRVLWALLMTCWSWTWKSLDTQSSHLRTLERVPSFSGFQACWREVRCKSRCYPYVLSSSTVIVTW